MGNEVAICISTRNRPKAFLKTESAIYSLLPPNAEVFVVDDASKPLYYPVANLCFTKRQGIPVVKNKSLELAMESGADHVFLFDDDCYPIAKDWHLPYINSPHPHLCYTFLPHTRIVDGHKYHALGNGCMMYVRREVVEKVGGFDTGFGMGKYEHVQWSHRIHAAGFTPHPFIDVLGSDKLFHAMDERNEVIRTFTDEERGKLMAENRAHYYKTRNLTEFISYK